MAFACCSSSQRNSEEFTRIPSTASTSASFAKLSSDELDMFEHWDTSCDPYWPNNNQNEVPASEPHPEVDDDSWWYSDAYAPDSKYEEWFLTYCHWHRKPRARRFVGVFNANAGHHNPTENQNSSEIPQIRERCGDDDEGDYHTPTPGDDSSMSRSSSVKSLIGSDIASSHEEDSDQNELSESKAQLFLPTSECEGSMLDLNQENHDRDLTPVPLARTRPTLNFKVASGESGCSREDSSETKRPSANYPDQYSQKSVQSGQQKYFHSPQAESECTTSEDSEKSIPPCEPSDRTDTQYAHYESPEFLQYLMPSSKDTSSESGSGQNGNFQLKNNRFNVDNTFFSHFEFSSGAALVIPIPTTSHEGHTYQFGPIQDNAEQTSSGCCFLSAAAAKAALNSQNQYNQLTFDCNDNITYVSEGTDPINWDETEAAIGKDMGKNSSIKKIESLDIQTLEPWTSSIEVTPTEVTAKDSSTMESEKVGRTKEISELKVLIAEPAENSPTTPESKVKEIEEIEKCELPTKIPPQLTQIFPKNSPALIPTNSTTQFEISLIDFGENDKSHSTVHLNSMRLPHMHSITPTTVFSKGSRHDMKTKKILNMVWSNSQLEMLKERSRSKASVAKKSSGKEILPKATASQRNVEKKRSVSFSPTVEIKSSSAVSKRAIRKSCIPVPTIKYRISPTEPPKLITTCENVSKEVEIQNIPKPQPLIRSNPNSPRSPRSPRVPISFRPSNTPKQAKLAQGGSCSYVQLAQRKALALADLDQSAPCSAHEIQLPGIHTTRSQENIQQNPKVMAIRGGGIETLV